MEPDPDTERDVPFLTAVPNPCGLQQQQPLRAAKSTAFKREERRRRKDRKRQERLALELARWEPLGAPPPRPATTGSPSRALPDTPWPCDAARPPDPAEADAWSWGPPAKAEPPRPPTVEIAVAAPPHPQAAALKSCHAFFEAHIEDEEEEEEEDELEDEGNAARFFGELLGNDAALRGFYEAEREKGQFLCLVCEGSGARSGKRFIGCAALVQHAGSIARTKRRQAHRAFAEAVGRLQGWGAGRTAPSPAGGSEDNSDYDQASNFAPQSVEMDMS